MLILSLALGTVPVLQLLPSYQSPLPLIQVIVANSTAIVSPFKIKVAESSSVFNCCKFSGVNSSFKTTEAKISPSSPGASPPS